MGKVGQRFDVIYNVLVTVEPNFTKLESWKKSTGTLLKQVIHLSFNLGRSKQYYFIQLTKTICEEIHWKPRYSIEHARNVLVMFTCLLAFYMFTVSDAKPSPNYVMHKFASFKGLIGQWNFAHELLRLFITNEVLYFGDSRCLGSIGRGLFGCIKVAWDTIQHGRQWPTKIVSNFEENTHNTSCSTHLK